jgi:hypothetical protein
MLYRYIRLRSKLEAVSNSCKSILIIVEFIISEQVKWSEVLLPIEYPELIIDRPELLVNLERKQVIESYIEI